MADNRKMLNFRCPLELLEAIDSIGKERYPVSNDNGCDRSKTLLDIIQAGIAALTNGDVVVDVKQPSKTSKTDLDLEAIEELVKKLIAENPPIIQSRLTDDHNYVRRYELPQKIDDRIANAIEDGIIGEAISKSYAAIMGQFNGLLSELQVLKNNIPAAPVKSPQSPVTNEQLAPGEDVGGNRQLDSMPNAQIQDLARENKTLRQLLKYEDIDLHLPISPNEIIEYFDIQDILDGAEYSDPILRERGIKSKIDGELSHFAKFIDLSQTHHSYVVTRFNRILKWLGFEPEKIKIIPTENKKSIEIWSVSGRKDFKSNRQTAAPPPITNAQSPITSSQLSLENDEELQPTSITEEKVEEAISTIPQNEPSPMTDREFILSLLPIGDILAGEQFTGTSLISQGVGMKIADNQRVIEERLGLILSESSLTDERYIMREFKKILLALGCEIEHKQIKRKVTYWIQNS
jgi:hypothetical protein